MTRHVKITGLEESSLLYKCLITLFSHWMKWQLFGSVYSPSGRLYWVTWYK